jgi:hypothetical protein
MKKHLSLLLCICISLYLNACKSNSTEETTDPAVADESLENIEGTETAVSPDANAGGTEGFSESVADTPPADGTTPPIELPLDAGAVPPADAGFTPDAAAPPADAVAVEPPPPSSEPAPPEAPSVADTGSSASKASNEVFEKSSAPKAPLKKIEPAPFNREGTLLNAVYIARPGESFSKISKKIYGDGSRSKELKKVNPGLGPKVGDKVYYNSPTRPTDDTAMKVYYEDVGQTAETYTTQAGDNLRTVSKKLLGFEGAWKELFVTNTTESSRKLEPGMELRYFKGDASAGGDPAKAQDVAQAGTEGGMPPMGANDIPPPPPVDAGMPDMPPPPPDMGNQPPQMAEMPPPPPPVEMAPPPPPPPPPIEMAPPPPPPPAQVAMKNNAEGGAANDDLFLILGAGGILAAGVAGLMVMRKRRQQREMASAFGDTQVGT